MRVAIVGAGGIGCYYGAKLQAAGNHVVYVARGEHLKALSDRGLQLTQESFEFFEPVQAVNDQTLMQNYSCDDFDLLLFAMKSNATQDVLCALKPWLAAGRCPVLSLQNGVENEIFIAEQIGNSRTIGGLAVRIGAHIVQPGVIEATGLAQVKLGPWPNGRSNPQTDWAKAIAQAFADAAVDTEYSADIQREMWRKLLINNGVNPLSALTELDSRAITRDRVLGECVYAIMQETARASQVDGVNLSEADVEQMFALIRDFNAIKTSMLVDYEKRRPLELAALSGVVIERCQKLGQPAHQTELISRLLEAKLQRQEYPGFG